MIGTKLAHYEITSHLGSGGMGEVYEATDTKLGRSVAIKFLPEAFSHDTERVARFQREARVLAILNHPNIAAIHGVEEIDTRHFLVMELVPGETLADRIKRGAIPIEEALPIAKQIAAALEEAHEKGIVHRDLKPTNIKMTPDGKVKVLDFGLAKAYEPEQREVSASNSPTMMSMAATNAGVILGTAAYMSPEQARGATVDKRSDLWAYGVVLFEMLTSRRLFDEPTTSDTLAAVLKSEIKFDALPSSVPSAIRGLLERCLDRDRHQRLRDIGEARIILEKVIAHPQREMESASLVPGASVEAQTGLRPMLPWAVALIAIAFAAVTAWVLWPRSIEPPSIIRLSSEVGANASLSSLASNVSLSPDGKLLAFVANKTASDQQIYLRKLDQLQASSLAGTEGARNPFFSPDGQWIAFFADGKLKKISVTGGAAVTLCGAPNDRGGAWAPGGFIVFAPDSRGGLFRVSSAGGASEPLTKLATDEATHRWPQILPDGRGILFTAGSTTTNFDDANIVFEAIPSGERKLIQRGGYFARYVPSGHLVYIHQGTLFAAPFDLNQLQMTGQPVPAAENVASTINTGGAQYGFSQTGSIAYVQGATRYAGVSLYWMDRDGKTQPLRPTVAQYSDTRFSPDGRRLALTIFEQIGQADIWVYEWARDTLSRLTFDPSIDRYPVWTPDGRRIAFSSQRADKQTYNLYWQRADGTGEPQRLTETKNQQWAWSWHPNGKFLAFQELRQNSQGGTYDIMILPMEGDEASGWKPGKPTVFLASPFTEGAPAFSPDGRWLAYQSNESGRFEIYVRPFPGPGSKWQISTEGGEYVTWSPTGKELYYRTADQQIMVSTYTTEGDSFRADRPRLWSEATFTDRGGAARNFDIHPDGKRFVVTKSPQPQTETTVDKVVFVLNFFDELRRIAPVGRK